MTALADSPAPMHDRSAHGGPGAGPAVIAGPSSAADRSRAVRDRARTVRSWPLLLLALPAAAEVWSGWAGIAQKTGFGLVSPLPGIWSSLHLDTTITLPVGAEAYAAYALRAWLAAEQWITPRTRRFAKWSAICSFLLGMAGQVAYHLLVQAGQSRAPWAITTIVSWSWSSPWGPRWPTCCAATPQSRTLRAAGLQSQPHGPRTCFPKTSSQTGRTRTRRSGPRPGPVLPRGPATRSYGTARYRPAGLSTLSSILRTRGRSRRSAWPAS